MNRKGRELEKKQSTENSTVQEKIPNARDMQSENQAPRMTR